MTMEHQAFPVESTDGWTLDLKRFVDPARHDRSRRPLVAVPGYAMNTFILGFHPTGLSMVEALCASGLEVWTADLRAQGGSSRDHWRRGTFGLRQLSLDDLPRSLDAVREHTLSNHQDVDLLGCSLGASMVYAYLGHHPHDHGVGQVVSVGGPLRWVETHPAMRAAFTSPRVAGLLPVFGTRALARVALPILTRAPALLNLYMNASRIDLSRADKLVNTVEDPVPYINRQVAHWMKNQDLVVDGLNITDALSGLAGPDVLCILANKDGIVPPAAARSVEGVLGADRVTVLEVGTPDRWYAHADLFIGEDCQRDVFDPMCAWLEERS